LKHKCKRRKVEAGAKSEKVEWELEGKLPPFSTYFFFSMVFFSLCFIFLLLENKKMSGESVWNRSAKTRGQKWEPKVKGENGNLKVSSLTSLGFFFCCFLVCFVFFVFEKKKTKAMCRRFLLWWCSSKESSGNLLPSPSSLVVLRFNLVVFGCL